MSDDRKDLPPVTSPNFLEKVREALQTYLGNRGNKLDRGLTLRDLADAGIVDVNPRYLSGPGGGVPPIGGAGSAIEAAYEPDLTPPPMPTLNDLPWGQDEHSVTAAISNMLVECDVATYTQGHGHAKSKLYGATWTAGNPPVFADAVLLTEFTGTVGSYATNPATTWHLWLTWVTRDGVESTSPAGGTNGFVVTTGQDVKPLLDVLAGEISNGQLHADLGARIDLVDDPATGLVTKVSDLELVYGDTVNAAASAALAAQSASDAAQAEANAVLAQGSAGVANASAVQAASDAAAAQAAAILAQSGAANSATTASTKATEAATSATNAAGSASSATTSASTASTAATNAGASATAASTSATNAATSATNSANSATASNTAKVAAESAKTAALGSATAAATSASTAATKATDAATSASAAATSATTASTKAGEASVSATNAATSETNAAGSASSASSSAGLAASSEGAAAISASTAGTKATEAATSATNAAGSASSAATSATTAATSATNAGNSAGAASTSATNAATSATNAGNSATASNSAKVAAESARDSASGSASAAATSASTATTKATDAATSASSAATSATTATTKAAAASTSATNASTSATNAAGSASSASTSATTAANSATAAGNSASAAAGSASTATTQATAAGNSATSANTAKVAAESARDAASGSASAAATSASSASTKATDAETSASAAASSATTASTKAGDASTYASNAATSATNAAGSATTASTQAGIATSAKNAAGDSAAAAYASQTASATSESNAAGSAASASSTLTTINAVVADAASAAVQTEAQARADETGALFAQYTVKTDVAGLVSGYGLASTAKNATPTSAFGVRSNQFFIAPPATASATAPTANLFDGYCWLDTSVTPNVTRYRVGSTWSLVSPMLPFVVQTTPTTVNGVVIPPGVFMDGAYIKNLNADRITSGTINGDYVNVTKALKAADITAGAIWTGDVTSTSNTVVDGVSYPSFTINASTGLATFNNAVVRGTVYANAGVIGGNTIDATSIHSGTTGYGTGAGFYLGSDGKFSLSDKLTWNGSVLNIVGGGTFSGALSAATGTFAGSLSAATGSFSGSLTASAIDAVDTINVRGEAVTVGRMAELISPIPIPPYSNTVIATVPTFMQDTGPVVLFFTGAVSSWVGSVIKIYKNGVAIPGASAFTSVNFIISYPTGSTTYTMVVENTVNIEKTATAARIVVMGLKK